MLKTLIPIVLAAMVVGAVLGFAGVMIVFLGQDWDDALFFVLAALMLDQRPAGRDDARHHPLRPRDDRLLRGTGRASTCSSGRRSSAAAQVIVYIGAISVLILFAIMLTQTKDAPSRLVFQTQAGPAAIASVVIAVLIALAVERHRLGRGRPSDPPGAPTHCRAVLFTDFVLPFEIVSVLLLAAVIGGVFLAKREPGGPS